MSIIKYAVYRERADRLATVNTEPSQTDQAGAEDTDINVIVKRYGVYGTVPSGMKTPIFGQDYSEVPTDLAEMIQTARSFERHRGELPPELANLTVEELVSYTPKQIADILNPPKTAPTEEPK